MHVHVLGAEFPPVRTDRPEADPLAIAAHEVVAVGAEPDEAYRFARGEQVNSNTGQAVKLSRAFDFFMITDHSDGMGAINDLTAGTPNILADAGGRKFHEAFAKGGADAQAAAVELVSQFAQGTLSPALNYQPGNPAYKRVWDDLLKAAERYNELHYEN